MFLFDPEGKVLAAQSQPVRSGLRHADLPCYERRMIDVAQLDRIRAGRGFLSIAETLALADTGNVVFDPFSLLVSRGVRIGSRNVFYPGVTLVCETGGTIVIGSDNQFGEGGFTARAEGGSSIEIGDGGRYTLGCSATAPAQLGSGSQILGAIAVQDCLLGAGGTFRDADPDARGAVLKGVGRARGLRLARGQVIQGDGLFNIADMKPQSFYHPPKK